MRIVIAGCGRVGSDLAISLADEAHDVSVIDLDASHFAALGGTFNGTTHEGSAYDVRTLRDAGIEFAEAFIAVTSNDNANVMSVQVARSVFGIEKTIARLDDPHRADAYRALDVRYVAASQLVSRVIHEQVIEEEFDYHVTFAGGDVEVVEMTVGQAAQGVTIDEFEIDDGLRVAAVRREGSTLIPRAGFELQAGDLVVAAARHGTRARISHWLVDVEPDLA